MVYLFFYSVIMSTILYNWMLLFDAGTYGLHAGDCCVTGVLPRVDFDCLNKSEVSTHVTI